MNYQIGTERRIVNIINVFTSDIYIALGSESGLLSFLNFVKDAERSS